MKTKNYLLTLFFAVLFIFSGMLSTAATITPANPGDADLNYQINVKDATMIQKFLVDLVTPNGLQKAVSEVDGDGVVTIKDVTMVQKYCAGLIDSFVTDNVYRDLHARALVADYDSGKAMTGLPVTFTVTANGFGRPFYYQFFVNDKAVTELTENNTYTCTFDEVGFYNVSVHVLSDYGITDRTFIHGYEVVAPYESDTLVIKSFYHDKSPHSLYEGCGKTTFTAQAMFGSGEYEYAFCLDGETVQDFSANNTFTIENFPDVEPNATHILTLFVRDALTMDVISQDMILDIGDEIMG